MITRFTGERLARLDGFLQRLIKFLQVGLGHVFKALS
jgi:hypothetical protein